MNLLKRFRFYKKLSRGVEIKEKNGILTIKNSSNETAKVVLASSIKFRKDYLRIIFKGRVLRGAYCLLKVYTSREKEIGLITFNSESILEINGGKISLVLEIPGNTDISIDIISLNELDSLDSFFEEQSFSDLLIITPSYPSPENKYLSGFVHSRLKAYNKAGIKFSLVCAFDYKEYTKYEFEGIKVIRVPFEGLRTIMRLHDFKKIAIHFFDWRYARILDASNLLDKQLYLWVHGPETLYWDWPYFTTRYFSPVTDITPEQHERFKKNDIIIKRYNEVKNVKWIFVSNWIKNRSEKLIGLKFHNSYVIPNFIDENNFKYSVKKPELRKNIFMIRRYDNINKYAVDIAVRAIIELSKKEIFGNLEFNIYGTGDFFEELFEPLFDFKNIKFHKEFLTHKEIADIHKQNGIGFFPTRYDAQGVSMCEAAMSGLAIISSNNDAIKEFIPSFGGNIVETEDYIEYAKQIEKIYNDEKYFIKLSKKCHDLVSKNCSFRKTIEEEIKMFSELEATKGSNLKNGGKRNSKRKIITVIVPAYNSQDFLRICVNSLLNHENRDSVEVIIVNDGSTDNTLEVARELEKYWNLLGSNLVRIINKENGGHGSTINVGIRSALGKYLRVVDSDDWVNSTDFSELVRILEKEDSDLVLTSYSEDRVGEESLIKQYCYESLSPGVKYHFDDLCANNRYGFNRWGPILATSNFKTELLKKADFTLTEKSPYVDMEFNMYSIVNVENVTFYDLDIYRYFIGRVGQTISKSSYMKNYLKHENILFNMINYVCKTEQISKAKKEYINTRLIDPMIHAQYLIVRGYYRSPSKFRDFDSKLKKYPLYYNSKSCHKMDILLGRKTMGLSVVLTPLFEKLASNKDLDRLAVKVKKIILKKE